VQVDVAKRGTGGDCRWKELRARIQKVLNFVCERERSDDRVKQGFEVPSDKKASSSTSRIETLECFTVQKLEEVYDDVVGPAIQFRKPIHLLGRRHGNSLGR
jgi:hypothetical protein